jgi:predicted dinucleotide-binding enzyme
LPPRSRLWMSSSGGPTRRWQRRPLKRYFGVLLEELDGLPSSAFVAKAFTGAKLVKGFNHLIAATLAADPIVEGGHRVVFLSSDDEDATAPVVALAKQLGFAPVKLGKLNEVARWCAHAAALGASSSSRICLGRSSNRSTTV